MDFNAVSKSILHLVCNHYGVEPAYVLSKCRTSLAVSARFVCAYLMIEKGFRQDQVGRFLQRERSDISYAVKQVNENHLGMLQAVATIRPFIEF